MTDERFDELFGDVSPLAGTTPLGLPYPSPSDPVAQGAANIQALATAVDTLLARLSPIASVLLAAPAATIDFPAIPAAGFTALRLVLSLRADNAAAANQAAIRFNGDAGNNYVSAASVLGSYIALAPIPAAASGVATFGAAEVIIPAYNNAARFKSAEYYGGFADTGAGASGHGASGGSWRNVAAINRITVVLTIAGNLVAGSRADLYGLPA